MMQAADTPRDPPGRRKQITSSQNYLISFSYDYTSTSLGKYFGIKLIFEFTAPGCQNGSMYFAAIFSALGLYFVLGIVFQGYFPVA